MRKKERENGCFERERERERATQLLLILRRAFAFAMLGSEGLPPFPIRGPSNGNK